MSLSWVLPIPAWSDNYMYLITDEVTKTAAIVDPVEPEKVANSAPLKSGVKLTHVLTTHHHGDHAGGNEKAARMFPSIQVYGGDDRIPAATHKVGHGDRFKVGSLDVTCLFTPCHTSGHICYYIVNQSGEKAVFTGDTLFVAGCGRFFEGSPDQMYDALVKKLGALPDETMVYCGHEYTVKNLQFAATVEPGNEDVRRKLSWAGRQSCTVPSTIGQEKTFNPFMRVDVPSLQQSMGASGPIETMAILRSKKDRF